LLFNSFLFLLAFLPITLLIWHFSTRIGKTWASIGVLSIASVVFYAIWNTPLVLLLFGSIGGNYVLSQALPESSKPKRLLWLGIGANVLLLCVFKYGGFFAETISVIPGINWVITGIALPLAISFFTFQQIAFLVDVYRGLVVKTSFRRYFLFISFFPQLIAGPIVRYEQMAPQFGKNLLGGITSKNLAIGLTIITFGLGKKVILADGLAGYVDPFYEAIAGGYEPQMIESWLISIAYSFQIYFDFSGYSDIAVGLAMLFGIRLPVNFMNPYRSSNLISFWRTWHVTLSSFLRDYLYIPLGGNRISIPRWYVNIFLVMLIGGLWHGAAWTFVAWGSVHGIGLMVNHFVRRASCGITLPAYFGWALTFVFATLAWVLFRADSFETAGTILSAMAGMNENLSSLNPAVVIGDLETMKYFGEVIVMFVGVAGFFAVLLPDTYQILGSNYGLNKGKTAFRFVRRDVQWKPSIKYGVVVTALLVLGLSQLFLRTNANQFIYFEF
jgi:alginate O-acetyltransferase complex protein AlgI